MKVREAALQLRRQGAARAPPKVGTLAWKFIGFPLDKVHDPLQDRLGRGLRQADDLVGRDVRQGLRRGDDGHPGRHRLGHLRARRSARSGSRSTASTAMKVTPADGRDPGRHAARRRCRRSPTTARSCRRTAGDGEPMTRPSARRPRVALRAARLDWVADARVARRCSLRRHAAGLVGDLAPRRPHRRRPHGVPASKQLVNIAIGARAAA